VNIFVRIFASAGGAGYFPIASGTVGSAVALALYWVIPGFDLWWVLAGASLLALLAGIPASSVMERQYGEDPSEVVIDEVVGMWISLLFVPKIWYLALIAFFVFRIFDIIKPPPARQFDRMHGGFGIMMDDVAAGVYANLVVQAARLLF
jgi:phosphatidylglycerophosphatase A